MAKRFIDTDLFKKQFVRHLKSAYKLFWIYVTTDCNHAGIWECDFDVARIRTGLKVDRETAKKVFKEKIVELDNGTKWFIPSFIEFQYGSLSDKNRAHTSIISILKRYDLIDDTNSLKPLHKDPTSPLQGAKDKDKDKEKEQEPEKEQQGGTGGKFLVPEMSMIFQQHISTYLPNIERDFKPLFSIATFLCEQAHAKGPLENHVDQILEIWDHLSTFISKDRFYSQKSLSTISNHIQEISQKAIHGDKSAKPINGSKLSQDKLKSKLAERFGETG